jgi:hypothetical protein
VSVDAETQILEANVIETVSKVHVESGIDDKAAHNPVHTRQRLCLRLRHPGNRCRLAHSSKTLEIQTLPRVVIVLGRSCH